MSNVFFQSFFIPTPTLTEENLPDQTGKVFIVTGGYAGCGKELSKILYSKNGTVYIAGRSQSKANDAITEIRSSAPSSTGKLEFLEVDLSNLATIKPAAEAFKAKESRLDVLTNNAGVMIPPSGSKDAHGRELQMGTNCLGPFLLTKLLYPLLQKTAASSTPGSVRVTWAGSAAVDLMSYKPGGLDLEESGEPKNKYQQMNYGQSKCGNLYLASEGAKRFGKDGVLNLCWNPGNLKSELQRHVPWWQLVSMNWMLYDARFGAYTELYAGLSQDITSENNGSYIIPWGRIGTFRSDIGEALKGTEEGGTGKSAKFWEWCEKTTSQYA